MQIVPALMVFVFASMLGAIWVAQPGDRSFLLKLMAIGWLILSPLTLIVDAWMPFSGGGDDESYFELAVFGVRTIEGLFDPMLFAGSMEQIGYPWLLAAIHFLLSPGLLGLKYFNLLLHLFTALAWYRIGCELADGRFGRRVAVVVLFLTPLWFYVFFLNKDLAIVLLQSFFLLCLVRTWRTGPLRAWALSAIAVVAIIPFRSALLVQSAAVAFGSIFIRWLGPGHGARSVLVSLLALPLLGSLLVLSTNPEFLAMFGIHAEHRVVGSEAMLATARQLGEESGLKRVLFPLLYVLSETAGLSRQAWSVLDAAWLRGVLALPWIAVIVPTFLLGIRWLLTRMPQRPGQRTTWGRLVNTHLIASPWAALGLFIGSYVLLSWVVGDTTRWRLPDMPVIATIAAAGWHFGSRRLAFNLVLAWVLVAGLAFSSFVLRGLL